MNRISRSSVSATFVLVAALIGVVIFLAYDSEIKERMDGDLFKITYQFLLIGVLGGAVSLLLKNVSSERDLARERRTALREMHSELLASFNIAKKVRRNLRAKVGYNSRKGLDPEAVIAASLYEEKIEELMAAQLDFEVHAKRASDSRLWFESGEALASQLREVEGYLNQIIREYEGKLDGFKGDPPERLLTELPVLSEFMGPYRKATHFKSRFAGPFKRALLELSNAGFA